MVLQKGIQEDALIFVRSLPGIHAVEGTRSVEVAQWQATFGEILRKGKNPSHSYCALLTRPSRT